MASFDIKSLFTNITLTETLKLCVQNLYKNESDVSNLTKSSFYSLLTITMESFLIINEDFTAQKMKFSIKDLVTFTEEILNGKLHFLCSVYEQCDGVVMDSPFTLVYIFMCHFENIWLENCFKPIVYRRFVDDTILLFRSKEHV